MPFGDGNKRPLCLSPDDAEQWTLTPAHFLRANLGSCTITQDPTLPVKMMPTAANLARFIRQDQHYNQLVWLQWKQLYLTYLRDKVPSSSPNAYRTSEYTPLVGDIVHVLDSNRSLECTNSQKSQTHPLQRRKSLSSGN